MKSVCGVPLTTARPVTRLTVPPLKLPAASRVSEESSEPLLLLSFQSFTPFVAVSASAAVPAWGPPGSG